MVVMVLTSYGQFPNLEGLISNMPDLDGIVNKSKFDHRKSTPLQPQFSHIENCTPITKNGGANDENSKIGCDLRL